MKTIEPTGDGATPAPLLVDRGARGAASHPAHVARELPDGDRSPFAIRMGGAGDEVRERIERAIRVIDAGGEPGAAARRAEGPDDSWAADHAIEPLEHARLYAGIAPELAHRLRASDVRVAAECFTERDGRANELRRELGWLSEWARTSVLVAGISAALLVATAGFAGVPQIDATLLRLLVLALSVTAVVASAAAAGLIYRIRGGALSERWMRRRAEAEAERLRFFSLIVDGSRFDEPLLQLEYFRRFQLDVQRKFFRDRADQHRRRADRRFSVVAITMVMAGIATGVAGVLGAAVATAWTGVAALALVAQAFGARAENREAAEQSARHAERYEQTALILDRLYARLDEVREATAALPPDAPPEAMRALVAAVHERMELEHREWLDDTRIGATALDELERLLGEAERRRGGSAGPPVKRSGASAAEVPTDA
jgi:hypothetical protein